MENYLPSSLKNFNVGNFNKIFLSVLAASVILGTVAGYLLAGTSQATPSSKSATGTTAQPPKNPQQDNKTFRDFAEGKIQKRPVSKDPSEYIEGTHLLIREGAVPVALTSSVVDLSQYEGKEVKVFGETQKAIKEGWLMDVGKVEVKN